MMAESLKRAQANLELTREDVAKAIEGWAEKTMFQGSFVRVLELGSFNDEGMIPFAFTLIAKPADEA